MSVRYTAPNRKMTGMTEDEVEIVLGYDSKGLPAVTINAGFQKGYSCYDDANVLIKLRDELNDAIQHLLSVS